MPALPWDLAPFCSLKAPKATASIGLRLLAGIAQYAPLILLFSRSSARSVQRVGVRVDRHAPAEILSDDLASGEAC